MLKCKQFEGTNCAHEWTRDAGPMYVDLKIKPGCELAAQVAIHIAAVQLAKTQGLAGVKTEQLRRWTHDVLASLCELNIADGTIHYNDETGARPAVR